jgi:hypothetical protein
MNAQHDGRSKRTNLVARRRDPGDRHFHHQDLEAFMIRNAGLLLCWSLVLGGCGVGSVAPIIEAGEEEFDPSLLGTWVDSGAAETAIVTAGVAGDYQISYTTVDMAVGAGAPDGAGTESTSIFRGRLGRLGSWRILEVRPDLSTVEGNDQYRSFVLPLHTLLFLHFVGDRVVLRALSPDSISAFLEREPGAVAHLRGEETLVLTASTGELRQFLAAFAGRPGVLVDTAVWHRRTGDPPIRNR